MSEPQQPPPRAPLLLRLRCRLAGWLLERSIRLNPGPFNDFVLDKATTLADQLLRQKMRARGVAACEVCLGTRGPLRRVGPYYACSDHLEPMRKRHAETSKLESVREAA